MKDAKGHGSNKRGGGMPIPGHAYHTKSDDELKYIQRDAHQAEKNVRDFDPAAAGKYSDQINDAATVLAYRGRGGERVVPQLGAMNSSGTMHPKSTPAPVHEGARGPQYNREAVNNAIASSNRSGRRIGGKEARAIHALLRGRH